MELRGLGRYRLRLWRRRSAPISDRQVTIVSPHFCTTRRSNSVSNDLHFVGRKLESICKKRDFYGHNLSSYNSFPIQLCVFKVGRDLLMISDLEFTNVCDQIVIFELKEFVADDRADTEPDLGSDVFDRFV